MTYGFWMRWSGLSLVLLLPFPLVGLRADKKRDPTPSPPTGREVWFFVPEGQKEPIFVPWKKLVARGTKRRRYRNTGVQHQSMALASVSIIRKQGEKYTRNLKLNGQLQLLATGKQSGLPWNTKSHLKERFGIPLIFKTQTTRLGRCSPFSAMPRKTSFMMIIRVGKRECCYLMAVQPVPHLVTFLDDSEPTGGSGKAQKKSKRNEPKDAA